MLEDSFNQSQAENNFSTDYSTFSKTQKIQNLVDALVRNYRDVVQPISKRLIKNNILEHDIPGNDLEAQKIWLGDAHQYFREISLKQASLSSVSEWMLDNYYIIRQTLQQIKDDLPSSFYLQLPKLSLGALKGFPRILGVARSFIMFQQFAFDPIDLIAILNEFQKSVPLSMGELWAFPIFLRYCLIEFLSQELVLTINPPKQPKLPTFLPDPIRSDLVLSPLDIAVEEVTNNEKIANIILSLRAISEQNWNEIFESVSCLEQTLRQDPTGNYAQMDFKTRDLYRKEIEELSLRTGIEENEIGKVLIKLAGSIDTVPNPNQQNHFPSKNHVGYYLFSRGRSLLEAQIGYKPDKKSSINEWLNHHKSSVYFFGIVFLSLLTLLFFLSIVLFIPQQIITVQCGSKCLSIWRAMNWIALSILFLALLNPALTIATSLVNWLITQKLRPKVLLKLDFKTGIPDPFQTLVVIPAMITSRNDVDSLAQQLELHYLRNPEPGLLFGLLTDFRDAETESLPEDIMLVQYATAVIEKLNQKYEDSPVEDNVEKGIDGMISTTEAKTVSDLFYLFHRKRLWNPSEGMWIGWERKRGKLFELNMLLRGGKNLSFSTITGDQSVLQNIHFVITLDTDTILPRGAACRLAGTLAHPLNQAVFDEQTGVVISGYTVLQPRMEIHPRSANHSWFTRLFSGDTGLDLYSLAVSDAYQDFFGEGSFVGKGIYAVDAFMRSIENKIPENTVLSHDLLEGIMGRAGLVTDITMIEDYPQNYFTQVLRQRRWIRGDWQLLPWLIRRNKQGKLFSSIDRWKIFDNLRRAMLSPALLILFIIGVLFQPGYNLLWTSVILLTLGIPILTGVAHSTMQVLVGENIRIAFRPFGWNLVRWGLAIAFIPYEAYIAFDAISTTLFRLYVSRHNLLQWTTAAQTAKVFGSQARKNLAWQKMSVSTMIALLLIVWMQFGFLHSPTGQVSTLLFTAPVLVLWLFSPLIAWWINRPITKKAVVLSESQVRHLRQITRRTWGFFERFVGPGDHWLPPDHFQEKPVGIIAHRTSPTNIGLLLTSTVAAYDMGYLDQLGLATRLSTTMDSLDQLERFRGHFLNWYDTLTLQPLHPRYLSTVDSGNLAASFIITAQACSSILDQPVFRWDLWQGYLDTLSNLTEMLKEMRKPEFNQQVEEVNSRITKLHSEILSVRTHPEQWYSLFLHASGPFWKDLSARLMGLVKVGRSAFTLKTLEKLQEVTAQVERHHSAIQRTINELVPWIPMFMTIPRFFSDQEITRQIGKIMENLPLNLSLGKIQICARAVLPLIQELQELSKLAADIQSENDSVRQGLNWLKELSEALLRAEMNSALLREHFVQIMARAEQFENEMDFGFLYHKQRSIFHIGFNLDSGVLDQNYYDLLASESRIASVVAIAKGDVPQSHWLHLGRPVTQVGRTWVLLSWSGTMFEYLMPPLFLRSYPGTLLADSTRGAVERQISYGREKSVPWGISEAGFYRFDTSQNYQYRAFGVPDLGFKRGLADDLVISPYASLMAINYAPQAVVRNIEELINLKMIGLYGVYESIDFTPDRLTLDEKSVIVSEYMAHHQGMILMAMANYFHDDIMVQRMHSDPRIQSVELILQEQIPQSNPVQDSYGEDVNGTQRLVVAPVEIVPWQVPVQTLIPQMHLISNGSYNVLISNMGGGYSSWRGVDLTRWQPDGVLDPWGAWIYVQEMNADMEKDGSFWSVCHQPIPAKAEDIQVTYLAHMAVFRRMQNGIDSNTEITVAPDDPVEIRRVHLHNGTDLHRTLQLTSYGEVILGSQAADSRHPAFNKLFIESEYVPDLNIQIFSRRPRSEKDATIFMGHMLIVKGRPSIARHESDRNIFIGRDRSMRNPQALTSNEYLTGSTGATLDPIFALGQSTIIAPHESADLAFLTFTAETRESLLALARRYSNWVMIDRSFHQANTSAQSWLSKQEISSQVFRNISQILSALLYPNKTMRATSDMLASNRLGQPGLWRFGISGDYPILLVEVNDPLQIDLVREALQVHKYLRSRRFKFDLVILNSQPTDYGAELNGALYRVASKMNGEEQLNQRGGVYILYGDQVRPDEYTLLQTAARIIFDGAMGSMDDQIPGYSLPVHHLPEFTPTRAAGDDANGERLFEDTPIIRKETLKYANGFGGFSPDGREYIINWEPDFFNKQGALFRKTTPAPWVNVIGYPKFGFMVSESGSQTTWALNSGENRLTPWSNDPVCDPTGEALYLRDEETGEVWTPTPLPAGAGEGYRVLHGAGYTIFENKSHGLEQVLTLFASPYDPVKIIHLKLKNTLSRTRRITATQYVEWVMGTTHAANMAYIIPEYDATHECLFATNPYSVEFGKRVAFLMASRSVHGLTADRTEFLGRGGSFAFPVALLRLGLETRISPGEDPCAVLQLHMDLLPGASDEIYFILGQGDDKEDALELVKKYRDPAYVGAAYEQTKVFWNRFLDAIQVQTPEPATDLILNRWMLYQTLSCRIWGRTGFYQSSGAFGFRDQLQDVLAVLPIDPAITRSQIINAARQQFEQGDVMHWWHPPLSRGVRTRFSDDLLWLPYVTSLYIETTGDMAILDEKIPFRVAPSLNEGEDERYGEYPFTRQTFSLMDHCLRAIDKGSTFGVHGLPLMGTGDWNDGMNRVGEKGMGESVWLAWFISDVLKRFAITCELYGDHPNAERFQLRAIKYVTAIEQSAWDGDWYRRAFYDSGETLGSTMDKECQIDAIAQSWSVLSGSGYADRNQQAMQSVLDRLVRSKDRLLLLLTPPFDKTSCDPGYIKGYRPGIRENGGQYTHAATWTAWAFAKMGCGQKAYDLFDLLNPVFQADSFKKASDYRVEPYVISADIYSKEPYVRRGGWTWYTGSAAWMYRLGLEGILGFRKIGNTLLIDPVIPANWDGFTIHYRFGGSKYLIQVKNPDHVTRKVTKIELDGHLLSGSSVPLIDDNLEHVVTILMGDTSH